MRLQAALQTWRAIDNMADLVEWLAPVVGLLGAFGGALLGSYLSRERWLHQRRWENREKYYLDLVTYLTRAELSLEGQREYYEGPDGSEYGDHSDDQQFHQFGKAASDALHAVKELVGPAELFLSRQTVGALRELVSEEWHLDRDAVEPGEYITRALALVRHARTTVIAVAKGELSSA